ncbi:Uncharacterised protein [Vibrio cholerae]|nr:Uncharacterised protein [Vibrio cholerae]CSC68619.1 Uncharacterised protein [Vibrio cholerae]
MNLFWVRIRQIRCVLLFKISIQPMQAVSRCLYRVMSRRTCGNTSLNKSANVNRCGVSTSMFLFVEYAVLSVISSKTRRVASWWMRILQRYLKRSNKKRHCLGHKLASFMRSILAGGRRLSSLPSKSGSWVLQSVSRFH